ncbi:hypothetical protein [Nonomuraea sp. NPDC001831]|uniref:hypothetical protein n=1 Tax=Nonomuraea sp. NPDC001831 TaxID=3364340 RepID=UPI00367E34E6
MAVFRPEGSTSQVLAELARLWDQARVHRPGAVMQKELAKASGVPYTTVNGWATGKAEPRDLDQLVRIGVTLAAWAQERAPSARAWDQLMRADRARRDAASPAVAGQRRGWPLAEVSDPFRFGLEVHRAIDVGDAALPALPVYVPRAHDRVLEQAVAAAAGGTSGIAVLVGGSSTGKTRACWQALDLLRGREEPWRLWHPIDPTRPDAVLAELAQIGPYTVVWLNEAQFYLADTVQGERVAAGLRELLRAPEQGPVLVLATLWRQHWTALTTQPSPGSSAPHAQARELLDGCGHCSPAISPRTSRWTIRAG